MLPLADRRILITRSRQQASGLAARLEALGASAIVIPAIEIAPPNSYAALDRALSELPDFDWLLFTSANAVAVFHRRMGPRSVPQGLKIAVVGPATATAARECGLRVNLTPPQAVAESLAAALIPELAGCSQPRILLVRAAVARDHLPQALTAAGAQVTVAEAYRTIVPEDSIAALRRVFSSPAAWPDAITFTSSSTATNLLALLEAAGLTLPPDILRASIGPITSATLRTLGVPPHLESSEATVDALVATLEAHFRKQ